MEAVITSPIRSVSRAIAVRITNGSIEWWGTAVLMSFSSAGVSTKKSVWILPRSAACA